MICRRLRRAGLLSDVNQLAHYRLTEIYAFPGLAFVRLGETQLMLRGTGTRDEADILDFKVPAIDTAHQRWPGGARCSQARRI